jgi:hypothetical protein
LSWLGFEPLLQSRSAFSVSFCGMDYNIDG